MKVTLYPSCLGGLLRVPASKSVMQRACAAALIRNGKTILDHPGRSADDTAALSVVMALGASVHWQDDQVLIDSPGLVSHRSGQVDCGESGLGMRLFTPLAACLSHPVTLTGGGSLKNRPMDFFDQVLPVLRVRVSTSQGKLPIEVQGPLVPASIEIEGTLSSQFLTGLLFAYAAAGAHDVSITVKGLVSKPYIDLTLSVLRSFGLPFPENRDYRVFHYGSSENSMAGPSPVPVAGMHQIAEATPYRSEVPFLYSVESDWSSASFLLVAGALAGTIHLQGLDVGSAQSDCAILQALHHAGVSYAIDAKGIVAHPSDIIPFVFDATDCPDLFPPLVVLAAYAKGDSTIKGAHRLEHKESNRAQTLQQEFAKMGVTIQLVDDALVVKGTGILQGAIVSACGDHRIAMALAVAALRASGPTTITGAEAVRKSYPDFFADLMMLGASLSLPNLK